MKARGGFYWVAYRLNGTLHKRYLGKADALTVEKPDQVGAIFDDIAAAVPPPA
jgi:hypothetical protein